MLTCNARPLLCQTMGSVEDKLFSEGLLPAIMFVASSFFLTLLLLNMIIANMGDSYAKIKQSEISEITMEKARMITTMELLYPWAHEYATYMHLLLPARKQDQKEHWEGVAGALTHMREDMDRRVDGLEVKVQKLSLQLQGVQKPLEEIRQLLADSCGV